MSNDNNTENTHSYLHKVLDYTKTHPDETARIAKTLGVLLGAALITKGGFNAGKMNTIDDLTQLQNDTVIVNPYTPLGPYDMVSSQPAEKHFARMKEGKQFWYRGQITTLIEKKNDDQLGTIGYFAVGKTLIIVPIGSLPDTMTIHEAFTKYSKRKSR